LRVLVTGGSGFVGSHVVEALDAGGHEVCVFDLRTPVRGNHVVGDLTRLDDVVDAVAGMDAICHLGAVGDVYLAMENPPLAA
jgi:nucleoside-diphosphate-sugar epimerase